MQKNEGEWGGWRVAERGLGVRWGVVYEVKTCFLEDLSIDTDSQEVDVQQIQQS